MAKQWSVTTEQLTQSANMIEEKTNKYNSEWAKLYTELESLKSSQWKGIASEEFNAKLEACRGDFKAMADTLLAFSEFLKNAAISYEKTEEELKAIASSLNSGK